MANSIDPEIELLLQAIARIPVEGAKSQTSILKKLESEFGLEIAREALNQWELRKKATIKFDMSAQMLFSREALEQSTHQQVAAYHASRFPTGATVWDLTTGIGGDLVELAKRGPVIGFEVDSQRAKYATYNASLVAAHSEVRQVSAEEALSDSLPEYIWVDPHRRDSEGRRMVDPGQYSPDPAKLAGSLSNCRLAGIKMSPLLKDDYLKALAPEIEFVSYGRECREVVAWMGSECIPGWRARHLESNSTLEQVDRLFTTAEPGKFLYDADPAAVRAHALKNFGLRQLGDSLGYLTGDDDLDSPRLSKYAVQYAGKGDVKSTKEACKRLGLSVFEVKKRNAEVDTDKLLRELSKVEGAPCSLVVFSVGKSVRHLLVN